eukprot:TRINITY_DN18907_c0_g1_i1.p1 TRINITY_DN18907_c0_g1~~TRINITY_DN18907_c0_g1_i1.p1  ORF type:complete len:375 (-),score=65.77 TRINITY_DN18907_c0_g1_i1:27-1151(-)
MSELEQAYEDLKCSVTGKSPQDGAAIGFGVEVTRTPKGVEIKTDLCPLSYEAFFSGQPRSSALGARLTHWLPFVVSKEHWARVLPTAKQCCSLIVRDTPTGFLPGDVLHVIGELWKTKAVEMMKCEEHASEKVLLGFVAFHHLLLAFAQSCPEIAREASHRVRDFTTYEQQRTKSKCPDFGRFLPLLLVSDIMWCGTSPFAASACIGELFNRNVLWILKQSPWLSDSAAPPARRICGSWEASQVGLRLTCFQVRYILDVGRPRTETDIVANLARLDALAGRPTRAMIDEFQQTTKRLQHLGSYYDWFLDMGLDKPSETDLMNMLLTAMDNSARLGYHGGGGSRGGYSGDHRTSSYRGGNDHDRNRRGRGSGWNV